MTASIIHPYQTDLFNTIPRLPSSERVFHKREGNNFLDHGLADLFSKHNVFDVFTVVLLHRHNTLKQGEAMVDANGTSSAWTLGNVDSNTTKYGGTVQPTTWMVLGSQLMPYEFAFSPTQDSGTLEGILSSPANIAFLEDFVAYVGTHELGGVFGVALAQGKGVHTMEISEGEVNITFKTPAGISYVGSDYVPAAWEYSREGSDGGIIKRMCFKNCNKASDGTHSADHD
jgi:hypothetical protein